MYLKRPRTAISASVLLALAAPVLDAAALTWDITSDGATITPGTGNWSLVDANWNNAGANEAWSQTSGTVATNSALFAGADAAADSYEIALSEPFATQGVTFNNTGYKLSGGAIFLGNSPTTTITNYSVTVAAGKTATINSNISGYNAAATFTVNLASVLNLGGNLDTIQGRFAGDGTLNITGGTSTLNQTNFNTNIINHTGGTITLQATSLNNIGFANGKNTSYTLSGSGVINAPSNGIVVGRTSNLSQTTTLTVQAGGAINIGTVGAGRLFLTGGVANNNFSSALVDVQGGSLTVGAGGSTNNITFFNNGSLANRTAVLKVSGGTVTSNGIQFGGPTAAATTYDATSSAAIQLTSGSLYVGTAGITRTSGATSLPVTIQLLGGTLGAAQNWSSTLDFRLGDVGPAIQAADSAGLARNITLSGVLSDDTTSGAFTKTGAGVLTLSGANTYSGATTVNEGVLVFGKKVGRSAASTVSVGATAGIGFGVHESDTTYFSKAETAAIFNNPSSSGFTLTAGAGIGMDVDSVAVSVDQTEVLTGSSSLVKSGSGTLILSGSNTYTGLTTVSAGDLVVNNAGSLGSGAAGAVVLNGARLALSNTTVTGESISITGNGGTGSLGALRGDSGYSKWDGPINISGAATLLDTRIGALSNATLEVAGVIDDGLLDQRLIYRQSDSTSKIIVSGANTYSGPTSVAGGVVEISSFNSVVGGSPSSSLGAPITPENSLVVISFLAVDGHLRYLGSGETTDRTITVGNGTAATNFANATLEHNGTGGALVFSAPVFNIAQVGVTATSPRTLILSGTNSALNTIFGVIQDNLVGASGTAAIALTKQGEGTWILAGANTYSGPTTIGAGTLTLGANGVLPDNSPVSLGAATLRAVTAGLETAATLDVTATGAIQLGSGAQIAFADSSAVDWTGGTLAVSGSFISGSSIRFGTTSAGLTATQLGLISGFGFTNFALNAEGYLTATSTVLPSYTTWADDPAKGNIPGEPAAGDFDADGISNLLEYGLGTNPRVAASLPAALAGNTVTYTKGADAIANGDVSWAIQASQTLAEGSWIDVVSQPVGDTTSTISHLFTPGNPARQFFRLRVTRVE
jgi:hypothetical protein